MTESPPPNTEQLAAETAYAAFKRTVNRIANKALGVPNFDSFPNTNRAFLQAYLHYTHQPGITDNAALGHRAASLANHFNHLPPYAQVDFRNYFNIDPGITVDPETILKHLQPPQPETQQRRTPPPPPAQPDATPENSTMTRETAEEILRKKQRQGDYTTKELENINKARETFRVM